MPKREAGDFPLLKYLDSLVEDLRKLVPPAIKGEDEDAVHDARVITRRLKAATDLLEATTTNRHRKPFNRVTKCLRRQLGPLRDLDVMLEHLGEFKQPGMESAVRWMKGRLDEIREEAVKCAATDAPPARMLARLGSWWGLHHEIAGAKDRISELLSQSVHLQLDAFVEQANDLTGQRRSDPHLLRIAGKSLRYTLEMAKEQGSRVPASVATLFKRMQTALGLWHDYVVLAERMMRESVESELALHDPQLQIQVLKLTQLTLGKSQGQLNKMGTLWKTRGEWLVGTIGEAFPLTRHMDGPSGAETPLPEHRESIVVESNSAPAA
jgi:CHAD domain-containing protein